MRKVMLISLALGLATIAWPVRADDSKAKTGQQKSPVNQPKADATKQAYIGVGVESMPPALSSQLRNVLPSGQGVLVTEVAPSSPAAKAGLQANDVLVSYDDQKLYSPEQLIKVVHVGAPGHDVTIGYIREGKPATCKVTLGERPTMSMNEVQQQPFQRPPSKEQFRKFFEQAQRRNDKGAWDLIDAIKLTRVDDQRWRAEIDYRTTDGKKEHKTFEGTRDTIRKDIESAKDIPANERSQLLHSLNLDNSMFEMRFPFGPFGQFSPVYRDHR